MNKLIRFVLNKSLGKQGALRIAHSLLVHTDQSVDSYLRYIVDKKYYLERDLISKSYKIAGIDDYGNEEHTGELFLIRKLLSKIINTETPVIFDVGANVGNYTSLIKRVYPTATVYAFEPNPKAFSSLYKLSDKGIHKFNVGLGKVKSKNEIFTYKSEQDSGEHATLLREVFTDLHKNSEIKAIDIQIDVLDDICIDENISKIDFLKIDTEGFEYEVLLGASRMIREDRISVIQLEFNEMNIVSKVFLRDFYHLLSKHFTFFRLKRNALIPLGDYDSLNEIFRYQNLILISKQVHLSLEMVR